MMPSANCGSLLQGNHYRQNVSVVFHSSMFDFIGICILRRLYSGVVRKFPSGSRFVEVGCWKGRSAIYMAIEIMNAQKNIRFDCVDTWEGSGEHSDVRHIAYDPIVLQKDALFYEFMNNTEPYRSIINPIRMDSFSASALYENESLDFVFLDSNHDYDHVINELSLWLPKIKPNGVLAGHDYNVYEGVRNAVNHFFYNNGICRNSKCHLVIAEESWIFIRDGEICDPILFSDETMPAGCRTIPSVSN